MVTYNKKHRTNNGHTHSKPGRSACGRDAPWSVRHPGITKSNDIFMLEADAPRSVPTASKTFSNLNAGARYLLFVVCCLLFFVFPVRAVTDDDYDLGERLYEHGRYLEALRAFGRSAKGGNTDAQYQIGIMFMDGQGVKASPEDAAYWWRKAAQNGHTSSQYEIGRCFETGTGVQADQRIAAEWYWRAAEGGDPDAALAVARMYRDGRGMKRDTRKARRYYGIAAKAGIPEAQTELDALNNK